MEKHMHTDTGIAKFNGTTHRGKLNMQKDR